ncbi:T9SS type A sorting domain-containing protein [Spirosoma jeollabukense]
MKKFTFLWALLLMAALRSYGQADPAVTIASVLPNPAAGVGGPLTISFAIGNNGSVPISGVNDANQMGFTISLGKAGAVPNDVSALSGTILNYFNVIYVPSGNGYYSFVGQQKTGVAIPANTLLTAVISATVSVATDYSVPGVYTSDIGASCNIQPSAATANVPGNDFASSYVRTVSPLPVSLVYFKAEAQSDKTVTVSWQTSMESGNKGYVVERSKDLTSFEAIGEVTDVAANSTSLNSYKFTDANPYRGTSYYRLKQVDLSGSSRTYAAAAVTIDGVYGVYPNPVAANNFSVSLDEPSSAVLHFYSATGRSIGVEKSGVGSSSVNLKPTEKLSSGIYLLQVEERGQVRTHRLVVQ